MPNNVDEKVVQLTFDNKQFEKGVAQSVKSLEDLKKALELDKMSNSLHSLEQTTSSMSDNFNILQRSVDQVSKAFTPLGRIVYKAMDDMATAIESRVKSFAKLATGLESLQDGQQKYEKYTKSVQVITNATGKSVDEVSKHLDKLLKYTDETSYDFSEMVSSIGKFTSVGIDLERAEAAMEGIANWAAKSGAGKAEANRAMYNISQAMGAGYMKLIDWKSIENANMATKEFKEMAIMTAEDMGVIAKNSGITYQNFNETLKEGWLTADVMTEVLSRYSATEGPFKDFGLAAFHAAQEALTFTDAIDALKDAMSSGWMKTYEYMFGNLDEARVMWTNFANALIEFSDIFTSARNDLLKSWHELGGYTAAIEAVSNAWQAFMNVAYAIRDVIASMFPPDFDEQLVAMTEHVRDITAGWKEMLGIDTYTEVSEEIDVMVNKAEEFTDTLKRGARGDSVRALQEQLVKAGYLTDKSGADGIYGPHTQEAVRSLQRALGVEVTGAWDSATRAAAIAQKSFMDTEKKEQKNTLKNVEEVTELQKQEIDHAENLNKVLKRGNRSEDVRALQAELVRLGYLSDESQADGIYGPKTEAAVKKFQKKIGTDVTGSWDEVTMAAAKSKKAMVEVNEEEVTVYKETSGVTAQTLTLQNIVKGIASSIKTVLGIIGGGIKIVLNVLKIFQPLVAVGFRVVAMFMDMFTTMNEGIQAGQGIEKISNAIVTALTPLAYLILFVAQCIDDFISGYAYFLNVTNKENSFVSFFEYLASVFAGNWIVEGFVSIFTSVKDIVVTTVEFILSVLGSLFGTEIDEVTGEPTQSGIVVFFQTILSLVGIAVQGLAYLVNSFVNVIKTLFATIGEYLGPAKDSISGFFSSIIEDVKSGKIKTFTDFFDSLTNALSKFTPIVDKIKSAKDNFVSTFREMFDTINGESDANDTSAVSSLFKTVKAFLLTVAKFDFTKYLLPAVGALATYGFFKSAFSLDAFSDVIGMIFSNNGLKSGGLNKVSFKLFGAISTIALAIGLLSMLDMNKVGEFFKSFNEWFSKTKIGIKFNEIKDSVKSWYDNTKLYFQEKFPTVFEFFKKKWNALRDFIKFDPNLSFFENLQNKFESLKSRITKIVSDIKDKLIEFKDYFVSLFKMNEEGTRLKLFDELEKLVSNFDVVTKFFIGIKDRFVEAVRSIFSAADGEDPKKSGKSVFDLFGMIGKFLAKIGSLDLGKMLNTAIMGLLAYGWFRGSKALQNFSEGFEFFISKGAIKKDNFGDTALKLAGAIAIVALSVALLSAIDLAKALGGIVLAGALVLGFVKLSKEFGKIKDEAAKDMGKQLLMMAGSIALLAVGITALMGVVWLISKFPGAGVGAFVILAAMLAGLTLIELKLKEGKGSSARISNVLDMCKGVLYLVVAFAGLIEIVKHNWNKEGGWQMAAAFGILTALLGELFAIEFFLNRNSNISSVSMNGILGMCVGVEILVMALGSLISIVKSNWSDPGPMIVAFLGLMSILGMLGGLMAIAKSPDAGKGSSVKVGALAIFMIAFAYAFESMAGALSEAVKNVKDVDIGIMITFMAGMGVFIGEYIGLISAASALTTNWTKIFGMAVAVGGMIGFAYAVGLMADGMAEAINKISSANPETVTTFFQGMFIMLLTAVGCVAVLGVLPIPVLIQGIVGLIGVGVVLGILVGVFASIGSAAISQVGESLWILGSDLSGFNELFNSVDWELFKTNVDSALSGIWALVTKLMSIANDVTTALTVAENVEDIGIQLQKLNDALSIISGDTSADMTAVQGFVDDTKAMVDTLNTISIAEGVTDTITELGSALNLYYKMIQGVGIDKETGEEFDLNLTKIDSQLLADAFSAIKDSIKEEDISVIQSYAEGGTHDMTKTAVGINAIAEAIKSYGSIADNLDEGKITTANGIIELFASIPEKLKMGDSKFDQLFSTFDGSNKSKLEGFSDDMYEIGNAVAHYITSIEDINVGKLFLANSTIGFLANLNNTLPSQTNGFLGKLLFGNSPLSTFGSSMKNLGDGIKQYTDNIKDADFTKVPDSLKAVDTLADISGKLEKSGGLNGLIDGEKNLGALGSGLDTLGTSLSSFATITTGFEYQKVSDQFQAIIDLISIFRSLDAIFFYDQNSRANLNKLTEFGIGVNNVFDEIGNIYNKTITTKEGTWPWPSDETMPVLDAVAAVGKGLTQALAESLKESTEGAENGMGPIQQALSETVINAAEAVKNESILAYYIETGRYLGEGLIQGFNEKYSSIIELMTNLGLDAPEELREVTEVESPSKIFAEIGKYWMDGLVKGINNTSPELIKATDMISSRVTELLSFHPITKDNPFGYLKDYYKEAGHAFEDDAPVVKYPLKFDDPLGLIKDAKNPIIEAAEETQEAIKDTEEVIRSAVDETTELMLKLDKNLKRGSRGDEVKQLQEYLSTLGFMPKDAKIDGIYGKITEQAVRNYQKSIGAAQTGAWDDNTRSRTKEYNKEIHSGLYKLRQPGKSIKRSDVDRIIQNAESFDQIAELIENNSQVRDRVVNRMTFGTKDYAISDSVMRRNLVSDNQAKIEALDQELVDLYFEAAENGSGHDPTFDKKQKKIMLQRRILQLEQFEYLNPKYKNSEGKYERAYFDKAYATFLKDIGYTTKDYKYNADRQYNIEDYIDRYGGIELLRATKGNKKNDLFGQKGWTFEALVDRYANNDITTDMYNAGAEGYESYITGFMDGAQGIDFSNPEETLSLLGLSNDTLSQMGDSAAGQLITSLTNGISSGDSSGVTAALQQFVPGLDFNTMGVEEVATMTSNWLSNNGASSNVVQGVVNGMTGYLMQSMQGAVTDGTIRPVVDESTGSGYVPTTGFTIPSAVSLDEASKITLSSIENKINDLGASFDETAAKLNQLATYVQDGFNMVKNKDGNVYIDGDSLVGKIGSRVSRYIGAETLRVSRAK